MEPSEMLSIVADGGITIVVEGVGTWRDET